MPWKPDCCISSTSKIIAGLKFDKNIVIQRLSQNVSYEASAGEEWTLATVLTAWADIKTKSTPTFVNGINTGIATTHIFTIRYSQTVYNQLEELTEKYWILYNNKRYNINVIENIDEENTLIRFIGSVRGKDENEYTKTK